jgi:hypothetical protein
MGKRLSAAVPFLVLDICKFTEGLYSAVVIARAGTLKEPLREPAYRPRHL